MKKIIFLFSIYFLSISISVAQESPEGRYCGQVLHSGQMVSMVLVLNKSENGTLIGKSYYDDDNKTRNTVILTMRETERPSETTINFIWEDVYGQGLASLVFNNDNSNFTGTWGSGLEKPFLPWIGKKCDDKVS